MERLRSRAPPYRDPPTGPKSSGTSPVLRQPLPPNRPAHTPETRTRAHANVWRARARARVDLPVLLWVEFGIGARMESLVVLH